MLDLLHGLSNQHKDDQEKGEDDVTIIYATRWLNLGTGISPEDPTWLSHNKKDKYSSEEPRYRGKSIREQFEGANGTSLEAFTKENERKLLSSTCSEEKLGKFVLHIPEGYVWQLGHSCGPTWVLTESDLAESTASALRGRLFKWIYNWLESLFDGIGRIEGYFGF